MCILYIKLFLCYLYNILKKKKVFDSGFVLLFLCCFCFVFAAFICMFCIFMTYSRAVIASVGTALG
jgi:hypothetical protein